MNHTITGSNISCNNINRISIVHNLDTTFCSLHKLNILSSEGSYGPGGNIGCHNCCTRNNVSGNNSSSLFSGQTFKVSTSPRSETILTKVVNEPAPTATSTTSPTAILGAGSAIGITGATAILCPW